MCLANGRARENICEAKGHRWYGDWQYPRCFIDRDELRRRAHWKRITRGEARLVIDDECEHCGKRVLSVDWEHLRTVDALADARHGVRWNPYRLCYESIQSVSEIDAPRPALVTPIVFREQL